MGLYDREYVREDDSRGLRLGGPRTMVATLILITAGLWLIDLLVGGDLGGKLSLRADLLTHPWNFYQLLTAGFVHDNSTIMHVLFNMFGLWLFGRDLEMLYGRKEFLRLYLTLIVLSSLVWVGVQALVHPGSRAVMLGASGAVVGVMMIYVLHYPKRTFLVNFFIPMPAWLMLVLFLAADLYGFGNSVRGGAASTAFETHLAGAFFGLLYWQLHRSAGFTLGRLLPQRLSLKSLKRRPKLRVHDAGPEDDAQELGDQVDRILEKISRQGEASLTAAERKTLEAASRRYQQRRS